MEQRWKNNNVAGVVQLLRRDVVFIGATLRDDVMILLARARRPEAFVKTAPFVLIADPRRAAPWCTSLE
jgi:hypothetical protein